MKLLFECADFFAVAKPAGLGMHTEHDALGVMVRLQSELGEPLFPVHRLDKHTSGVLLVARNVEAAAHFQTLFSNRAIEKYYVAVGGNKPKKKQGLISGDMKKGRNGSWLLLKSQTNPARTQFFSQGTGTGARLYILRPLTGKTHQLRVALKSIGAPIVGDTRYKGAPAPRLMLHASALRFRWHSNDICITHPAHLEPDFYSLPWASYPELEHPWAYPWPESATPP
ncbi:pseudouridine synthase [Aliidiomarina celeris]|uniref:pseudouridine synthase n=1 Tax=Aliidiomarina celeris TaxID=2249428 RepID=UPI001E479779|nr:pseudouridine synthase [Aliidiomarina celeris]